MGLGSWVQIFFLTPLSVFGEKDGVETWPHFPRQVPQRIKPMLSMWGTWFLGKDWSLCNLAPLAWPSCVERKIKLRHLLFSLQNLQMGPKFPREHVCPRQQGNIENPCFPRVIWAHSGHLTMEFRPIVDGESSFPVNLSPFVMGNHFFQRASLIYLKEPCEILKKEIGHFEIFMFDIGGWHGYFCVKDWAPFNSSILFSACPFWDLNRKILFGNCTKTLNIYQDTSAVKLDK